MASILGQIALMHGTGKANIKRDGNEQLQRAGEAHYYYPCKPPRACGALATFVNRARMMRDPSVSGNKQSASRQGTRFVQTRAWMRMPYGRRGWIQRTGPWQKAPDLCTKYHVSSRQSSYALGDIFVSLRPGEHSRRTRTNADPRLHCARSPPIPQTSFTNEAAGFQLLITEDRSGISHFSLATCTYLS
ncbi:uncharacterized protein M421DRAFT_377440 [Didymella exigua CBS 183.55]|uniref:Uncharacterized protein n=1 Tax=Didymella exigua CBS 183.55 TaxID=1150837 RepID=A0A6A5RZB7_9PLEO|nr:uncharacterized protein M421DRAFT_377440 [Didymella exigua CBS 183.55]KAF1930597.1 hypothetical protein M421DRAFT_377440 [Didymella exigua CBS 183.55]